MTTATEKKLELPVGHPFIKKYEKSVGFTELGYMAWLLVRGDSLDRAYEAAYISFTCPPKRAKNHHQLAIAKLQEINAAGGYEQLPYWPDYAIVSGGLDFTSG